MYAAGMSTDSESVVCSSAACASHFVACACAFVAVFARMYRRYTSRRR